MDRTSSNDTFLARRGVDGGHALTLHLDVRDYGDLLRVAGRQQLSPEGLIEQILHDALPHHIIAPVLFNPEPPAN